MKIEDCIENFILSINEKNSQLFCNLLGPKELSKLRKKLYINRNYISINRYVKERYLEKLSRLVSPLYSYEYFKRGNKYIVKYKYAINKSYFITEFNVSESENDSLISLNITKIQAKI
ncbi:hypothetical protein [Staphylococcus shinii]|uniref:hypothetical protein n=1 Tax=Staphylococcus shinii TaxID=2912228 RepID=UPI000E68676F|nr:hypothetical protein [Staphylococcus shinii]RIM98426.1 hypothetical protein BU113_09065 [Staphylococcus shinii]